MKSTVLHSRDWEELAAMDPLWAILSDPEKRFGKWQLEEFFRSGAEEITQLMEKATALGLPKTRARAIDFGCGVGRLTRALRDHFSECHGVDISSSMVETARRLNPNCEFRQGANLESFPAGWADFIYSTMVLQHQPDAASAARIIADMLRVLSPGGLLVFQMPARMKWRNRLQLRRRAYRLLRALGMPHTFLYERLKLNPIRMVALPQAEVERIVTGEGGSVLKIEYIGDANTDYLSGVYFCAKQVEHSSSSR